MLNIYLCNINAYICNTVKIDFIFLVKLVLFSKFYFKQKFKHLKDFLELEAFKRYAPLQPKIKIFILNF